MITIEHRIEKMEKTIRNYRLLFLLTVLPAIIFLFTFSRRDTVNDIVKAKTFQVVDDYGHVLASLTNTNSAGQLIINDNKGNKLVNILKSDGGTGAIAVFDDKGNFTWRVTYTEGGGGSMNLYNKYGKAVFETSTTDRQTGFMSINNEKGNQMCEVTYTADNFGGWLGLYNGNGKNTLRAYNSAKGGAVAVYNNNEENILTIGTSVNNHGIMNVYNSSGTRINAVGADDKGDGAIDTWNHSGSMTGNMPK